MRPAARALLPTDVLALTSYGSRSFDNRAWPLERLGSDASSHPLALLLDKVRTLGRDREAWVSIDHQRLLGLIAARPRDGRSAWEIDSLIDAAMLRDGQGEGLDVIRSLLDCALAGVGERGGEKLFVRLSAGDSALVDTFRDAGFALYREETLYARPGVLPAPGAAALQPALVSDSYPRFRLYAATTPDPERRMEAATFAEWHAAQERRWLRHGGVELVQHRGGALGVSCRAAKLPWGTLIDLTADDEAARAADAIVAAAASAAGAGRSMLHVLVPSSAESVARRLEEAGFTGKRQFVSLVRRTTVLKTLPARLPAVAQNAVGV